MSVPIRTFSVVPPGRFAGCVKLISTRALAAGIRDSSATVEMARAFASMDQVVNRIVC